MSFCYATYTHTIPSIPLSLPPPRYLCIIALRFQDQDLDVWKVTKPVQQQVSIADRQIHVSHKCIIHRRERREHSFTFVQWWNW